MNIGYCMDKADEKKIDKYALRFRVLGIDFNAFAMDIFGGKYGKILPN
jgi:hypothetical protein